MFKSMMIAAAVVALGTAGAAIAQDHHDDHGMQQDGGDMHRNDRGGDRHDGMRGDSGNYNRDSHRGRYFHNGRYYQSRYHYHHHWMYR